LIALLATAGLIALDGDSTAAADLDSYLKSAGYESVAFKPNERSQPLLECVLAGRKHVFLVDTGCGMTTLEPSGAVGLKTLGELGVVLEDSFLGKITNGSIALMDKLMIGRAQFLNQPALVEKLDMDFVRLGFDGILGLDFFFRNFCLIDCYQHKFYARGSRPTEEQSVAFQELLLRSGFTEVPLESEHFLAIEAKVKNLPVRLLVDTGASISTLDQSQAARLNLTPVKWEDPAEGSLIRNDVSGTLVGFGKIGTHKIWVTMLSKFEIGPSRWNNISYGVANLKDWKLSKLGAPGDALQGILGADLLESRGGALIDFAGRKLWLRPRK
jgi:predicted aspartyl protease